jgi:hypothetical protein
MPSHYSHKGERDSRSGRQRLYNDDYGYDDDERDDDYGYYNSSPSSRYSTSGPSGRKSHNYNKKDDDERSRQDSHRSPRRSGV